MVLENNQNLEYKGFKQNIFFTSYYKQNAIVWRQK